VPSIPSAVSPASGTFLVHNVLLASGGRGTVRELNQPNPCVDLGLPSPVTLTLPLLRHQAAHPLQSHLHPLPGDARVERVAEREPERQVVA
jgi:hypothetical protein